MIFRQKTRKSGLLAAAWALPGLLALTGGGRGIPLPKIGVQEALTRKLLGRPDPYIGDSVVPMGTTKSPI